jgi:hypothetical protein
LRERDRWGDPGVDGRIILEWIFKKWEVVVRTIFFLSFSFHQFILPTITYISFLADICSSPPL